MSKYSGAKKVEWSPAGAATWTDLGRVKEDSSFEPEAATEKDSGGRAIYAGTEDKMVLHVYDATKEAAVRARQLSDVDADNLIDVRVTYLDDTPVTYSNLSPIVSSPKGFATKARNYWVLTLTRFTI